MNWDDPNCLVEAMKSQFQNATHKQKVTIIEGWMVEAAMFQTMRTGTNSIEHPLMKIFRGFTNTSIVSPLLKAGSMGRMSPSFVGAAKSRDQG